LVVGSIATTSLIIGITAAIIAGLIIGITAIAAPRPHAPPSTEIESRTDP
jgi:hypothetical protein